MFSVGDIVVYSFPMSLRQLTGYVDRVGYDGKLKVIMLNMKGQDAASYWIDPNNRRLTKVS